ncbi:MAG: tetratricopeptide repeat protein [Anaerolineae bacterium]
MNISNAIPTWAHGGAVRRHTCAFRLPVPASQMATLAGRTLAIGAIGVALGACGLMRSPHERGVRYLDAGNYDKAYEAFSEAIEDARADGDDELLAIALANRSFANDALDRHEEAIRDATESLELAPDDPVVINNRGVAYLSLRRFDEAQADFERALELEPDYAEAYANRGRLHMGREEFTEALDDLDKALELDDSLALAYANRATVYENLGDLDESLADYERSLEIARDPDVLFTRGMLLFRFSRYHEALEDFKEVADLEPDSYLGYRASSQVDFLEQFIKNVPEELMPPTAAPDDDASSADADDAEGDDTGEGVDDGAADGADEGSGSGADDGAASATSDDAGG